MRDAIILHFGLLVGVGFVILAAALGAAADDLGDVMFASTAAGAVQANDAADIRAETIALVIPSILWVGTFAPIVFLWARGTRFNRLVIPSCLWAVAALVIFFSVDPFV